MRYLLPIVVLVMASLGCQKMNGFVPPSLEYRVTGSDSFAVIQVSYLEPGTDSTIQFSVANLPWSHGFHGSSGDSVAVSVSAINPTVTPGTLAVTIFVRGTQLLDSPNNPDSCITHEYPGDSVCTVESGGRM
jgi:hypothetical protein